MDKEKVKTKSFEVAPVDNVNKDLELVNQHTVKPLTIDEVYMFKVVLCDNDIDRVNDKMTDNFLVEYAQASKGLTGLKDHDWESDNQLARLYDTEVVTDDSTLTKLGEPRKYVLGKAYTLTKYKDYIDKINAGLLKESSISFASVGDTCSICGAVTVKGKDDIAICPNGHVMGKEYDGKLCYNSINKLKDSYEWSLVAVPCQRNSGIKNKNLGNGGISIMKKSMFMLQKLLNSKAFKEADEETQKALQEAVDTAADADLSEDDIKALIAENTKLKEEVSLLKEKVKEAEGGRIRDKIESIVSKAVDEMKPLTPTVKENIMRDIDLNGLKLEDGQIAGLDDVFTGIKEKYKGLIAEAEAEHEEPDGDEEEEEDEAGAENKTDDETLETLKQKALAKKHNSGITFGVNSNTKSVQAVKSGRSFN